MSVGAKMEEEMDSEELRDGFDEAKEGERALEDALSDIKEHIGRLDQEEQFKIIEMVSEELEVPEKDAEELDWKKEKARDEEKLRAVEEALKSIKGEVDDEVFEAALEDYPDL